MPVILKATIKCDRYDCKASIDVDFVIEVDDGHGIPSFKLDESGAFYESGWLYGLEKRDRRRFSSYPSIEPCLCPGHNPARNKT